MTGKGWRYPVFQPSARLHFRRSELALSNLVWPCSWPCCEQKDGTKGPLRSLPAWITLWSGIGSHFLYHTLIRQALARWFFWSTTGTFQVSKHGISSADGNQWINLQRSACCWYSACMRNFSDIPPWNHTPALKEKKKLFPQITHRYHKNIHITT